MKIRKFFSFVVGTILLSLSVSVISNAAVNTSPITSPLVEPEPYLKTVGDHLEASVYYVVNRPGDVNELYNLVASYPIGTTVKFMYTFPSGNNSNQRVNLWSDQSPLVVTSFNNADFCGEYTVYDIETGNLIQQDYNQVKNEAGGYTLSFRAGYFPRKSGIYQENDFNYGYPIYPANMQVYAGTYPEVLNVTPYVTWSTKPPDHNVYHSQLSEPVADEYNSYFVCNDKLYWISYRVNGLYSFQNSIEVESQTYVQTETYSGSGSGSYAGSQNGYTESFSLSGQEGGAVQAGSTPSGYLGSWQSDPAQIYYVGVSQGSINTSHAGTVTYNNVQVYPVSYSGETINRFFNVCAYVEDNKSFYLRIYPNNDQMASLIVDMDIYTSEFNLTDGSYISSTFNTYQGSVLYAGEHVQLSEASISDVRCYGLQFKNITNIPVNLSDVIWEYDLEFVQWQQSMIQVLQQIYNLINNSSGETENVTLQDFAGELQSAEQNYSNLNAQDFNVMLGEALPAGKYDNAASQIKQWISDFSIGELIAVCVFALALGTVTLTLGKKKSD